jgi:hypothetical protein
MTGGAPREDLSQFLRQHKQGSGLSFRDLAGRAVDPESGQSLGFQWLDRLAKNQIARPSPRSCARSLLRCALTIK